MKLALVSLVFAWAATTLAWLDSKRSALLATRPFESQVRRFDERWGKAFYVFFIVAFASGSVVASILMGFVGIPRDVQPFISMVVFLVAGITVERLQKRRRSQRMQDSPAAPSASRR